jgi:hypothetical protein
VTEFVVLNEAAFRRAIEKLGDGLEPDLAFAFAQIGIEFDGRAQDLIRGAYSPSRPSAADHLQSRSGALARDGTRHVVQRGSKLADLSLRIFITRGYGALHEFGGEIRPVAARALTIPLAANLDPSGLQILSPREWRATGETFVYNDHTGRGFIVRKDPSQPGELVFLFVFVDRVEMPARWGLRRDWSSAEMGRIRGQETIAAIRRATARPRS